MAAEQVYLGLGEMGEEEEVEVDEELEGVLLETNWAGDIGEGKEAGEGGDVVRRVVGLLRDALL